MGKKKAAKKTTEKTADPRQQSVPAFTEQEMPLIRIAMKIEAIPSQGQWVKRAAIMWARHITMSDTAKLNSAVQELLDEMNARTGNSAQ